MSTESPARPIQSPRRRSDELLTTIADRLGARFGAASVYAPPVERDGITVIPVATVRFGLGGGAGTDPAKGGEGEGAGAGGAATAAGYIELKDGRSRYVPIVRPERMLALVSLALLAGLALARPRAAKRSRRLAFFA
jgi:uncharacterized spore protein YtfJ